MHNFSSHILHMHRNGGDHSCLLNLHDQASFKGQIQLVKNVVDGGYIAALPIEHVYNQWRRKIL